jgi:DNA-binding beta-propeller fold protein YncE
MARLWRLLIGVVLLLGSSCMAPSVPVAAAAPHGALTQLPGRDGCAAFRQDDCRAGTFGGDELVLSPDGRFVYVGSGEGTVGAYRRNRRTGAIWAIRGRRGCLVNPRTAFFGPVRRCGRWKALGPGELDETQLAISPDGRNLYVGSSQPFPPKQTIVTLRGSLLTLSRSVSRGTIRARSCIAFRLRGCSKARAIEGPVSDVAVSADGRTVYAASDVSQGSRRHGSSLAIFARNPRSGALRQLPGSAGCIAPDWYSGCLTARGLNEGTSALTLSPEGRNLYLAATDGTSPPDPVEGSVAVFVRDPATGALSQLPGEAGCVTTDGREGCGLARTLGTWPPQLPGLEVSPDGLHMYASLQTSDGLAGGIATFGRDPVTGALTQLSGEAGCTSQRRRPGCKRGRALWSPRSVTVSPDGMNVYLTAFNSHAVAVFVRDSGGILSQPAGPAGCVGGHQGPPLPGPPGSGPITDEGCTPTKASADISYDLAISPNGAYAYASGEGIISVLGRNAPRVTMRLSTRRCIRPRAAGRVTVESHARLRRVRLRLNGRIFRTLRRGRFRFRVPRHLGSRRRHRLSAVASDRIGRRGARVVRLPRCRGA